MIDVFFKISFRYDDLGMLEARVFIEDIAEGKIRQEWDSLGIGASIPQESIASAKRLALTQRLLVSPVFLKEPPLQERMIESFISKLHEYSFTIPKVVRNHASSFRVRVKRHGHGVPKRLTPLLERQVGALVKKKIGLRVNLQNPDIVLYVEYSKDLAIIGWGIPVSSVYEYEKTGPKTRPFFGVGVLDPVVARVLVNLTGIKKSEVLLDPFCGMGGILIEAGKVGSFAIGGDISRHKVYGARINLKSEGLPNSEVVRHDAVHLPFRRISYVATDPPYAIGTKVFGEKSAEKLVENFLSKAREMMNDKGRIAMALPDYIFEKINVGKAGFKILHEGKQKVHGGLHRLVRVLSVA